MKKILLSKIIFTIILMVGLFSLPALARGWANDGVEWYYLEEEGVVATDIIRSSGDDKFYLDNYGFMVRDYLLEGYNDAVYYFDDSGKMVRNTWVAVDPTQVTNQMDNGPTVYLYYFGNNGKAYRANNGGCVKKTIDGKKYLFNDNGQMLSGWIDEQGGRYNEYDTEHDPFIGYCYYAGNETDGVLREGWMEYTDGSIDNKYYLKPSLFFYFNKTNNKKIKCETAADFVKKKINGHTYGFDENGVMIQGWDVDILEETVAKTYAKGTNYFFEDKKKETAGQMYKKGWIFSPPSLEQDEEEHDQEVDRWFYAKASGQIVKNEMRKINSSYYVFDKKGIMKHSLCIINKNTGEFEYCMDTEKTDGKDFVISRYFIDETVGKTHSEVPATNYYKLFNDETSKIYYFENDETSSDYGKRKTGDVKVSFADDDYTFASSNLGGFNEYKKKKYYQAGVLLKANSNLGLGLVFIGYSTVSTATCPDEHPKYNYVAGTERPYTNPDVNHEGKLTDYVVYRDYFDAPSGETYYPLFAVIDGNGNKINRTNIVKRDKNGNYWALRTQGAFGRAFEVQVKYDKTKGKWFFKSERMNAKQKGVSTWIEFYDGTNDASCYDIYGKTCTFLKLEDGKSYAVRLDDTYCTNFRFKD